MDDLARLVRWVAQDLDDRGYPYAAVVRRAAAALAAGESAAAGGCGRCGGEVVQPRTGRPRKFCFDCSPRKTREKGVLGGHDLLVRMKGRGGRRSPGPRQ